MEPTVGGKVGQSLIWSEQKSQEWWIFQVGNTREIWWQVLNTAWSGRCREEEVSNSRKLETEVEMFFGKLTVAVYFRLMISWGRRSEAIGARRFMTGINCPN